MVKVSRWKQFWRNLPIGRKLFFVIVGIVGIVVITTTTTTLLFFSVTKSYQSVINEQMGTWFVQHEIKHHISTRINSVQRYLLTGDSSALDIFEQSSRDAKEMEEYLLKHTEPHKLNEVKNFIELSQDWDFALRNQVIPVYKLGNKADAMITMKYLIEPMAENLVNSVNQFSKQKENEIRNLGRQTVIQSQIALIIGIMLGITTVVVALVLSWVLTRTITQPIQSLQHGTQRLAKGDLEYQVPVSGKDELGQLGLAFNSMGTKLRKLIEELNQINQQLRIESRRAQESTRLKTEFLATMSHELRTPLNGIIGFSEALKEEYYGKLNPKQLEYVRHIENNGEHLLSLINDILDLSKIEAGKVDFHFQKVEIDAFFSKSLVVVEQKAKLKEITLEFKNLSNIKEMELDPKRVTQILNNLLSNAVKFTPDGGTVGLKIEDNRKFLQVSVWDTGIGIRKDRLKKILQPFYQDEGNYDRRFEGTGLGLALTEKIVTLHGGTLLVQSEIGIGSTFIFTLPLAPREVINRRVQTAYKTYSRPSFYTHSKIEEKPRIWLIEGGQPYIEELEKEYGDRYQFFSYSLKEIDKRWHQNQNEENPPLCIFFFYHGEILIDELTLKDWVKWIQEMAIPVNVYSDVELSLKEKGSLFRIAKSIKEIPVIDNSDPTPFMQFIKEVIH